MGKVDDQRAMREAKYASRQRTANPVTAGSAPKAPAAGPKSAAPARPALAAPAAGPASVPVGLDELCGHRSIGNKSCTREKGHQAGGTKNHRYG